MEDIFDFIEAIDGQEWKVVHKLKDIVVIVLFATLDNADDWVEIEIFARSNEQLLKRYITLENGIPSHDTIQRLMSCINPQVFQQLIVLWNEMLNRKEGEKLKKFYVLMEKLCVEIEINLKKLYMLFLFGQEKMVYLLAKNQLMEKVRKLKL